MLMVLISRSSRVNEDDSSFDGDEVRKKVILINLHSNLPILSPYPLYILLHPLYSYASTSTPSTQ
jgi:hypothetical protein